MKSLLLGALLLAALAGPALVQGQNYSLNRARVAGGGGLSSGGSYDLLCTFGQADGGPMSGDNFAILGGFLMQVSGGTSSNTTTTLASSLNPSAYGSSVTFTSTVSPSAASGTVTFKDGATTLGTGTLSGGMATYTTSALTVGSHSITAEYAGDSSYEGSTNSSPLAQVVNSACSQETVAYSTGFEADNGNYTVSGNAGWAWGTPSAVGPTGAHSGTKCWGTVLNANAPSPCEGYLNSPSIALRSLAATEAARVSFYAYLDIDGSSCKGEFLVSSNGTVWQSLISFYEQSGGGWNRYEADVSAYAGGPLYLRFRLYIASGSASKPGMYVDDVALTISGTPGLATALTLEANEDASASCPWLYVWDGTRFVQDNDIYATARGEAGALRDFYALRRPLVAADGKYLMQIREIESEDSWTDFVELRSVDHEAGVAIAPDDHGGIWAYRPGGLLAPQSAQASTGADVLDALRARDEAGFPAYGNDYVDLDFGTADISQGAILVVRIKRLMDGQGVAVPFVGPPAVLVETLAANGEYQEVGRLRPRYEPTECAFNLASVLPDSSGKVAVRLRSIAFDAKYNVIDYAALAPGSEPTKQITAMPLTTATYAGRDVTGELTAADKTSVHLTTGNQIELSFTAAAQTLAERDFVFVSEGYYIPRGSTYFVYTWDGTAWAMRGSWGFQTVDTTHGFDLSPFLPDPAGEYKVRVWQNQALASAAIDYLALSVGTTTGTLATATYLPTTQDIRTQVQASDDNRFDLPANASRNRWTEFKWSGLPANQPPVASTVTFNGSAIGWTYFDADGNPQVSAQAQVWTGASGCGVCLWDSGTVPGTAASMNYAGPALVPGQPYYARLKVCDGMNAGAWVNATPFTAPSAGVVLSVASANPASGVSITVNPADAGGLGNGVTPFTRTNAPGTVVSLTAPLAASGRVFARWEQDSALLSTNLLVSVTNDTPHTLTAVYATSLVASNRTYTRSAGALLRIPVSDLAAMSIGGTPGLQSAGPSTNGASLTWNGTYLLYQSGINLDDGFPYTLTNGITSASGIVTVNMLVQGGVARNIVVTNGLVTVSFFGIPGLGYDVQRAQSMTEPVTWTTLNGVPLNPGANGAFSYTDNSPPPGTAYYRAIPHALPPGK